MRYPVTITPDDGQYTVTFPDVPEAVTFGGTVEEAYHHAVDALLTVFDAFMADKRAIPAPSRIRKDAIEVPPLETCKIELYKAMRAQDIGKAELARRLDWHRPQVDRVLDVHHPSQVDQMATALCAVGKRMVIQVVDAGESLIMKPRHVTLPVSAIRLTSQPVAPWRHRQGPSRERSRRVSVAGTARPRRRRTRTVTRRRPGTRAPR
jgi:antitoxin HicB